MQLRAAIFALAGIAMAAAAQDVAAEKEADASPPAVGAAAATTGSIPNGYKLNMLIRTTLIALNQANQTGNYSVLRDLGTPQFQAMNSDAQLAEIFAALRRRNLDFSPVIFFDPKLVREPAVRSNGLLRLTGYIPTEPERILFDMGFERIGEQWRLSAIVIDVQPAPASASAKSTPPANDARPKNAPKKKAEPAKSGGKATTP